MFLKCPSLATYWQRVTKKIIDSLGVGVGLTPALCLLNSLKGNEKIVGKMALWLEVAITTAKRVIIRHWAGKNNPYYSEWFTALSETAPHKRLIYKINRKMDIHTEIWEPFLTQIRET